MSAFQIALTGLSAAQTDLEVTGHNIANASTVGFKEGRAEFADLYASSISDTSSRSAGRGVFVTRVAQQFSQGSIDFTGNNLDLGITGEGFFITTSREGEVFYTRSGQFSVDRDGYVVNFADRKLKVFPVTSPDPYDIQNLTFSASGTPASLANVRLPTALGEPRSTKNISLDLNLDSTETVPANPFDVTDPATYNHSTATTVYDSLGQAHTSSFYFVKTGANAWDVHVYTDRGDGTMVADPANPTAVTFDTNGKLLTPAAPSIQALAPVTNNGSTTPILIDLHLADLTQYGSTFDVNELIQDGFATGRLSGIDIDSSGVVFARYTNGQSQALGKVALANFNNLQGLKRVGDTAWQETFGSGEVRVGAPQTSNLGAVQSGSLEASNADLSKQLVNLILAQRNYQANAQTVSTASTMTQTILNIR